MKKKYYRNMMRNTGFLVFVCMSLMMSCGKNDEANEGDRVYDPSKPIELTSFYPDSGKYLEKIM